MDIRPATPEDAPTIQAIYSPYVLDTAISFETEAPSIAELAQRIDRARATYDWLVACIDGEIAGYAYGSAHRARAAYNKSVEVSAYVNPVFQRRGIGRQLYDALFVSLDKLGYRRAFAGITLPNRASVALHESVGFEHIGVFPEVGSKFNQWHDVGWWQRPVADRKSVV